MEYKDTLNLPQTSLEMRANATQKEPKTQEFWEKINVYEKNLAQREKSKSFVLHDGPPYLSSGKIHVGTALNKILKDILIRYKSMRGYYAPYVPGYDGHGLPIENKVVKNIEGGRSALTPAQLREKCREYAHESLKGQEGEFKRLGVWGDWAHPYLTIDPEFEAEQVRVFGEMYKKGYIEKGLKPVYWCASCETALAEAEVEYADISSKSIYVRFRFDEPSTEKIKKLIDLGGRNVYAIIWTTTPWTIPSNVAISMHPRFEYSFFEYKGDIYIAATDLLGAFLADTGIEESEIKIVGSCIGQDLELLEVKHPLIDRNSKIILGEHVTLDAGTGLVHTAPGHGLEDYEVGVKYGIEVLSPLDAKGCWTEEGRIPELVGVPYYKGNDMVIDMLTEKKALMYQNEINHSYPHCWRCKKPVIYRATPQWFVKVDRFRDKACEAIKNVKWIPASGESRIGNMVAGRTDWCISRQRAWGVPIPVFYCEDCGEAIVTDETIENVAKIFEKESSDAWVKRTAEDLLPQGFVCPKCGKTHFKKENDIMDVWFDSGVTWRTVVEKRADELGHIPVDMYLEGSDQHRGWFQSSLLTSVAVAEKAPYKQVLTHGFVFGEDGRKMSKSLGNYIRPDDIIEKYGADILRLWAASVDYRNDTKIGDNIVKQLTEIFKKTRNTARFLLGNIHDFNPAVDYVKYDDLKPIDKFALHKLNKVIAEITESFENYEFYKYFQALQNFAAVDLSSFYLDIVKDRLYTAGKKSLSRRACQTVLYENLQALVRVLTPVMPHQAEDIWQNTPEMQRGGGKYGVYKSVLLTDWPEIHSEWNNEELEEEFASILKTREVVTRAIEPLRADKKVGSSLEVAVHIKSPEVELLKKHAKDIADIFIVSQAYTAEDAPSDVLNEYTEDDVTVWVTKAEGEKCCRCWKYRTLNSEGICGDCAEAVENILVK